jgi:nitrite reductase/ring-hydroxylating ferredoxin subunit
MLGAAATVLAGCGMPVDMGDAAPDGASLPDANSQPDAMSQPDATMDGTCPAGVMPIGRPESFALGMPRLVTGNVFVVRDVMGFYALSSLCTHRGCDVSATASGFRCPCHSATFDRNGAVTGGPAPFPLPHFAMCVLSDGQLGVDTITMVAADVRLTP